MKAKFMQSQFSIQIQFDAFSTSFKLARKQTQVSLFGIDFVFTLSQFLCNEKGDDIKVSSFSEGNNLEINSVLIAFNCDFM